MDVQIHGVEPIDQCVSVLDCGPSFLMCCMCDVTVEDMRDVMTGAALCEQHKNAAKLQSLMHLHTTIHFAHKDEIGDFRPKTLAEASC